MERTSLFVTYLLVLAASLVSIGPAGPLAVAIQEEAAGSMSRDEVVLMATLDELSGVRHRPDRLRNHELLPARGDSAADRRVQAERAPLVRRGRLRPTSRSDSPGDGSCSSGSARRDELPGPIESSPLEIGVTDPDVERHAIAET